MKKLFKTLTKRLFLLVTALLIVALPLLYLSILNSPTVSAAWYDDNWAYRQAANLTVTSSSSDVTNLQTLLTLNTSTLISAGKLQSSCADLRFTNASGKPLPYYIDSGCNTTTTKIWVLADLVPKNTTTYTMYVYYGNQTASAGSNSQPYFDNVVNLKGYWTMNESSGATVKDSSITANNGTATGTTVTTHTNFSNARTFPGGAGDTDYVTVSDHANLNPTTQITIEAWVYQAASQSDKQIVIKNMTNGNGGYRLSATTGGRFYINLPTSGFNNALTTAAAYSTGAWHHVAATYDGANIKIYVDGQLDNSVARTGNIGTGDGTTSLYFGRYTNPSANANLNGNLDDVKIYSTARTAAQILNDYNNTLPNGTSINIASAAVGTSVPSTSFATEEKSPGPIAYWKLDEGFGTTTSDSTRGGATATFSGSPTWQTEDQCISGKCLLFNGSTANLTVARAISNVQTVTLWVRPTSVTSSALIDLDGGTHKITISSGTISATGFTSPTIYVNGAVSSTLVANQWQQVEVTTATSFSTTASLTVGKSGATFFQGSMDDIKLYNSARTSAQVKADYNSRGAVTGSAANLGSNPQNNTVALSQGLVGYWKMDEASGNLTDSSGNANTGTVTGTTVAAGKFGNGRTFNGSSDYISTTLNAQPSAMPSTTWAAWIKPSSISVNQEVLGTDDGGWDRAVNINRNSDQSFNIFTGSGNWSPVLADLNQWQHIVVIYTPTNIYFYKNGVQYTFGSAPTGQATTKNFTLGKNPNATEYYQGQIDETRVYNRALSPAEVQALYNFAPGPVGYWKFDEGSGSSVQDSSGNANTGTLSVGATGTQTAAAQAWKPGKYGAGLSFDGTDDSASVANTISGVGTVEYWVNPSSPTASMLALTGSTYVSASSGTVSATGFTSPTIYVNGVPNGTLTANTWNHVAVTTATGISASAITFGLANSTYLNGRLDDVRIYNYARTQKQIVEDMNAGHPAVGSPVGSAVGHWRFDEGYGTTANNVGNGGSTLNGTLTSMASPATSTSGWTQGGKFGKGLLFDGSNDYVNLTTNSSTNFGSTNDFTLSAWIYPTTLNTYNTIVSRRVNSPSIQGYHLFVRSTGVINFSSFNAGSLVDSLNTDAGIISTNNWYHVVLTHASGGNTTIYVNGVSRLSQTTGSGDFSTSSTALLVGSQNPATPSDFFTGTIDEPKIYNYALTADEVKADMNRGSSQVLGSLSDKTGTGYEGGKQAANQEYCVPGDTTSCAVPVGRWDFDEATGTSVNDKSGNANTGSWNGTGAKHWLPGKVNSAGNFNGSNDYVSKSSPSFATNTVGTISAWIYPTAAVAGGIVSVGDTTLDSNEYTGLFYHWGGTANILIYAYSGGFKYFAVTPDNVCPINQWCHVEWTQGASSPYNTVYVNGQKQTLTYTNGSDQNWWFNNMGGTQKLTMGVRYRSVSSADTYDTYFTGKIDQVRVFNYARSAAQVAWDYNQGKPIGYWRFDECQGDRVNDSSGNSLTGTLTATSTIGTCTTASTFWGGSGGTGAGKFNYAPIFNGTGDYFTVGNTSKTINAVSLWVKPSSTTQNILDLDGGTHTITVSGGTISANGFSSPTIYVDGVATSTLSDTNWHLITVTTATGFSASNMVIGKISTNFYSGQIDDVKIYNYALTATQVKTLMNDGAVRFGPVTGTP